jgi:protein-L-isoaspartate O-methyltransferase
MRPGPVRGTYDRIVSTVAVRPIPASWLAALRPGGRLVTYHRYSPDHYRGQDRRWWGHRAYGMGRAGFMHTWVGVDYPPGVTEEFAVVRDRMVIRSAWAAIPW